MGDINVYSGPMKCGKTQQILNEYKRQLIAGKKVKMFKPTIDTRAGRDVVASRNGIDISSEEFKELDQIIKNGVNNDKSIYQIKVENSDKINKSLTTLYRYIDIGLEQMRLLIYSQ